MGKVKKILAVVLIFVMLAGYMPAAGSQAATQPDYVIEYNPLGGTNSYSDSALEAFQACQGGGLISFHKSYHLDMKRWPQSMISTPHMMIIVEKGATLTIGPEGLPLNCQLRVKGNLDLESSTGNIWGSGEIVVCEGGTYRKRPYDIRRPEDICFTAKNISYGQSLSDAEIADDNVNWKTTTEGKWSFAKPSHIPQAGTRCYDVVFTPKYPMTYDSVTYENCGQVTVAQAVPKLKTYKVPELHYGENLLEVNPECSFANPLTGESVKGKLTFENGSQPVGSVGEQTVLSVFTPEDSNYAVACQYIKINVLPVVPEVTVYPKSRGQGRYGQTLQDIQLLPGKCRNPYTGKEIRGKWEWKNPSERLQIGENVYPVLFIPEETDYETREEKISLTVLPKEMETIQWPESSGIVYGQSLADSKLSFQKNEYGTFAWENANLRPGVRNKGVRVVFTPADTNVYDWSKLDGYNPQEKTVTFTIPVQVKPLPGRLPSVTAAALSSGSTLSAAKLKLDNPASGTVGWLEPDQKISASGEYTALFEPADKYNYDWTEFKPDASGKIRIPVKVVVREKDSVNSQKVVLPVIPNTQTLASGEKAPVIITRMVTQRSTICFPKRKSRPGKTRIKKIKRSKTRVRIVCKKISNAKYEVQYSTRKNWRSAKKKYSARPAVTIKKLKVNKKYYFRVRAWKMVKKKKVYGKWSKVKRR